MVKMPKGGFRAVPSRTAVFYIAYAAYHPEFSPFFLSLFRRSRRISPCCKNCRKTLRQRRICTVFAVFTKRKSDTRNRAFLSVLPILSSGLPVSFTFSSQSARILPMELVMDGGILSRFPKSCQRSCNYKQRSLEMKHIAKRLLSLLLVVCLVLSVAVIRQARQRPS